MKVQTNFTESDFIGNKSISSYLQTEEQPLLPKRGASLNKTAQNVTERLYEDSLTRREKKEEELRTYLKISTPSFKPKLCPKSVEIVSSRFSHSSSDRLYESAKKTKQRLSKLRKEYLKLEKKQLTFHPKINSCSTDTTRSSISLSSVFDRLTESTGKKTLERKKKENEKKKIQKELEECTFSARKSVEKIRREQESCLKRVLGIVTGGFGTKETLIVKNEQSKLPIQLVSEINKEGFK
eukprot:snap_masked-scaffold_24-processed-gene-5.6-mRNA-1 protein AED:1.00 eAED:1.00 QI:0/-1/0/0/-1/1/1/0/238